MSYKLVGQRMLVEKETINQTMMSQDGQFTGIVKILAVPEDLKQKFKENDRVLLASLNAYLEAPNGEIYIAESQILRFV